MALLLAATSCASGISDGTASAPAPKDPVSQDPVSQARDTEDQTTAPAAPATATTSPQHDLAAQPTAPAPGSSDCNVTTARAFDLERDLISLHYDHAPDKDDGHAAASAKDVASTLGFTPWVVSGAYGPDNGKGYNEEAEAVMDAVWGTSWVNAHANWDAAVTQTADAWEQALTRCGDVWIAEGGQSDFSADVVRELTERMTDLVTNQRIHLVQHSSFNANNTSDTALEYVKMQTNYIFIGDGNRGGNGTANLNELGYSGPFVEQALQGSNAAGWTAAFEYYSPTVRVDFSDTVELLHILGIGIEDVADIDDFGDQFTN